MNSLHYSHRNISKVYLFDLRINFIDTATKPQSPGGR
jgi:hypothetical protein